jgi:FKBP-type peptidyl-prolyl cis-trans isomerase 2
VKIEDGKRVRIKVKLKVVDGDVIEESAAEYFQGAGTIIPGLEKALEGLEPGAEKKGVIKHTEAFDAVGDLPVKKIPRAEFPEGTKLEVGSTFGAKSPDGQDITFRVESVDDEVVEVHFVHPLSGKDIEFEVTVLSVTDPEPPPLPGDALKADE